MPLVLAVAHARCLHTRETGTDTAPLLEIPTRFVRGADTFVGNARSGAIGVRADLHRGEVHGRGPIGVRFHEVAAAAARAGEAPGAQVARRGHG